MTIFKKINKLIKTINNINNIEQNSITINNNIIEINQHLKDIKFILSEGKSESCNFIFDSIYINEKWGINKGSGSGSDVDYTFNYRKFIQNFLKENNIKSVLDIGCGDWQFSKFIDFSEVNYIGYDVSDIVINNNRRLYEDKNISFYKYDGNFDTLPSADLALCKDCLQHLPNEYIHKFIKNIYKYKYLIITNDIKNEHVMSELKNNSDIQIGQWRPLDLSSEPFNIKCKECFRFEDETPAVHKISILVKN